MRPKLTTIRCPFSAARCRHVHTEPSTTFTCEGSCLRISVTCVRTCGSVNADTQERCMCRGMHTGERGDNIIMSRKGISARAPEQRERARPRSRMARPALHLVQPPHDASGASRPAPCFDASGASSPHITRRRCARGGRTVPRARSGPAGGAPAGRETGRFAHAHTRRSAPRAPPPRRREVSRQTAPHCAHTKISVPPSSTEQKFRVLRTLCAQRALLAISGERHARSPVSGTRAARTPGAGDGGRSADAPASGTHR
jgi:hypothetical protein